MRECRTPHPDCKKRSAGPLVGRVAAGLLSECGQSKKGRCSSHRLWRCLAAPPATDGLGGGRDRAGTQSKPHWRRQAEPPSCSRQGHPESLRPELPSVSVELWLHHCESGQGQEQATHGGQMGQSRTGGLDPLHGQTLPSSTRTSRLPALPAGPNQVGKEKAPRGRESVHPGRGYKTTMDGDSARSGGEKERDLEEEKIAGPAWAPAVPVPGGSCERLSALGTGQPGSVGRPRLSKLRVRG